MFALETDKQCSPAYRIGLERIGKSVLLINGLRRDVIGGTSIPWQRATLASR
jgi:hypothetical protein